MDTGTGAGTGKSPSDYLQGAVIRVSPGLGSGCVVQKPPSLVLSSCCVVPQLLLSSGTEATPHIGQGPNGHSKCHSSMAKGGLQRRSSHFWCVLADDWGSLRFRLALLDFSWANSCPNCLPASLAAQHSASSGGAMTCSFQNLWVCSLLLAPHANR